MTIQEQLQLLAAGKKVNIIDTKLEVTFLTENKDGSATILQDGKDIHLSKSQYDARKRKQQASGETIVNFLGPNYLK